MCCQSKHKMYKKYQGVSYHKNCISLKMWGIIILLYIDFALRTLSVESRFTGNFHPHHVIKKLLRTFEVSRGHFFKKLRGLNAEVVSSSISAVNTTRVKYRRCASRFSVSHVQFSMNRHWLITMKNTGLISFEENTRLLYKVYVVWCSLLCRSSVKQYDYKCCRVKEK